MWINIQDKYNIVSMGDRCGVYVLDLCGKRCKYVRKQEFNQV